MAKNNNGLGSFAVRSDDGSIDVNASVEKFTKDLAAYKEIQENGTAEVMAHHDAVRASLGDATVNFGYLCGAVLARMNPGPEEYNETKERIDATLRAVYEVKKGRSKSGLQKRSTTTE